MTTYDLQGFCLLNTRPRHQAACLTKRIINAHGRVLHCPTLVITPLTQWQQTLTQLKEVDAIIFTSTNAVTHFFKQKPWTTWPSLKACVAVGHATAQALDAYSMSTITIPHQADSEHIVGLPLWHQQNIHHILLVKGQGGRTLITDYLTSLGKKVTLLEVYQRQLPKVNSQKLMHWYQEDGFDAILATSGESIQNLFRLFPITTHDWLKTKPWLVISKRLGHIANEHGIHQHHQTDLDTILETINHIRTKA